MSNMGRRRGRRNRLFSDTTGTPLRPVNEDSDDEDTPEVPLTPSFGGSARKHREQGDYFVTWKNKYDPKEHSVTSFVAWFETHARLNGYSEAERCAQLLTSFGANTTRILRCLPDPYRYSQLLAAIRNHYEPTSSRRRLRAELLSRTRKPNETAREFADQLEELSLKAFPNDDFDARNERLLDIYVRQQPAASKQALAIKDPECLLDAVSFLDNYEAVTKTSEKPTPNESAVSPVPTAVAATATTQYTTPMAVTEMSKCPNCPPPENDMVSYEAILDSMVDETVDEVNACALMMMPDGSMEDPVDFTECFEARVQWRFPSMSARIKCLYCGGTNHDETSCYKLLRRLNQRGFDPSRLRMRPRQAYNPTSRYQPRYTPPYQPRFQPRQTSPYQPRTVYPPGQSPWSSSQRQQRPFRPQTERLRAGPTKSNQATTTEPEQEVELQDTPLNS